MSLLPGGALLFDTGIYIRFSRRERYLWLGEVHRVFQRMILSAAVAAELYADTRDQREKRALDRLCQAHQALGHFSYPPASSWIETGNFLHRARGRFGQMHFVRRHLRDLLIALEASRAHATLVTENLDDFERWKGLLQSASRTLKLFSPSLLI